MQNNALSPAEQGVSPNYSQQSVNGDQQFSPRKMAETQARHLMREICSRLPIPKKQRQSMERVAKVADFDHKTGDVYWHQTPKFSGLDAKTLRTMRASAERDGWSEWTGQKRNRTLLMKFNMLAAARRVGLEGVDLSVLDARTWPDDEARERRDKATREARDLAFSGDGRERDRYNVLRFLHDQQSMPFGLFSLVKDRLQKRSARGNVSKLLKVQDQATLRHVLGVMPAEHIELHNLLRGRKTAPSIPEHLKPAYHALRKEASDDLRYLRGLGRGGSGRTTDPRKALITFEGKVGSGPSAKVIYSVHPSVADVIAECRSERKKGHVDQAQRAAWIANVVGGELEGGTPENSEGLYIEQIETPEFSQQIQMDEIPETPAWVYEQAGMQARPEMEAEIHGTTQTGDDITQTQPANSPSQNDDDLVLKAANAAPATSETQEVEAKPETYSLLEGPKTDASTQDAAEVEELTASNDNHTPAAGNVISMMERRRARVYWKRRVHRTDGSGTPAEPMNDMTTFTPDVQTWSFDDWNVRTVTIDGKPWFVAMDVAKALGYADEDKAIRTHCKKPTSVSDLSVTRQNGGIEIHHRSKLIPESDIYRLVAKSHLPAAERFEEWIFEDVLPTIRKTGSYGQPAIPSNMSEALRLAADEHERAEQLAIENRRRPEIRPSALDQNPTTPPIFLSRNGLKQFPRALGAGHQPPPLRRSERPNPKGTLNHEIPAQHPATDGQRC